MPLRTLKIVKWQSVGVLLMTCGGGNWSWRVPPRGRAIDELSSLISLIGNLSLDFNGIEKWMWAGDVSGKFKVSSLTKSIQNIALGDSVVGYHHFWNPWIPRKVNICMWRSSLNRLPTCSNLVRWGVNISSNLCHLYVNAIEEIEHSIINCPRAIAVWRKVWSWWCLSPSLSFPSFTISDIALNRIRTPGCARLNKVLHGVVSVTIWAI
ncbi:RNA-directed DNA polymerase, eukaryota, reverse transcriptase zinc-binding domain protein [Tanacetum coccineum]